MARPAAIYPISIGRDENGRLTLAGHSLVSLAVQYGTPLYIYDAATVRQQIGNLQKAMEDRYPASVEITYAAKSYFSLLFARKLSQMNVGVDVVSMGEFRIAQKAGFRPTRIHLHGNNKSEEELLEGIDQAIQAIVIDSLEELEFVAALAAERHKRPLVWLRITPGVDVDTHPYRKTAHAHSKFGLGVANGQAAEAIREAKANPHLHLTGLHMHLGSQIFEVEPYQRSIRLLIELAESCGFTPKELSPGGGLGVPYHPDDLEFNMNAWVDGVIETVRTEYEKRNWRLPKLVIEPGRWITARAGLAVYTIGSTKKGADGSVIVSVDGGMADNPRPAMYQAKYTCMVAEKAAAALAGRARIVGKFCESGDELIAETWLPEVERGDHLVVPAAGAYQLSMSSNYNLAPRPAVLWVEQGKVEVLQRREYPEESAWWMGQ